MKKPRVPPSEKVQEQTVRKSVGKKNNDEVPANVHEKVRPTLESVVCFGLNFAFNFIIACVCELFLCSHIPILYLFQTLNLKIFIRTA